jgi:hypothetical protein
LTHVHSGLDGHVDGLLVQRHRVQELQNLGHGGSTTKEAEGLSDARPREAGHEAC